MLPYLHVSRSTQNLTAFTFHRSYQDIHLIIFSLFTYITALYDPVNGSSFAFGYHSWLWEIN